MVRRSPMQTLITCEHASGAVPEGIDLGLSAEILASHVSTDRGAKAIAESLAAALEAPLLLGEWSRLVVDLNRMEDNPAVMLAETYGHRVIGNEGLTDADREARLARYHRPHRNAARGHAQRMASEGVCLHLSMHSFAPSVDPVKRTYDAGVLYDTERAFECRIATAIIDGLSARGWETRHNEPYAGTPEGLTSWLRAQLPEERYLGLEIEASQAWVDDAARATQFAADLAAIAKSLPAA